jgi:hypothetical protein
MMSTVGAAVAPDTSAAPVLGDDPLHGGKGFDRRRWPWNAPGLARFAPIWTASATSGAWARPLNVISGSGFVAAAKAAHGRCRPCRP